MASKSSFFSSKKTLYSLVFILFFLTLTLGIPVFFFETPLGNQIVVKQACGFLKEKGIYMDSTSIKGRFPRDFTIKSLTYTSPSRSFEVTGENLHVQFQWLDLLRGHLVFPLLHIKKVRILSKDSSSPEELSLPNVPLLMQGLKQGLAKLIPQTFLIHLRLCDMRIESLEHFMTGRWLAWDVQGSASWPKGENARDILKLSAQETTFHTKIDVSLAPSLKFGFEGKCSVEDPESGFLRSFENISGATTLKTNFFYSLKDNQLTLHFQGQNSRYGSLSGITSLYDSHSLALSGDLDYQITLNPESFDSQIPSQWGLSASFSMWENTLQVKAFHLESALLNLEGSSTYNGASDNFHLSFTGDIFIDPTLGEVGLSLIKTLFPNLLSSASPSAPTETLPISFSLKKNQDPKVTFSSQLGEDQSSLTVHGHYDGQNQNILAHLHGLSQEADTTLKGQINYKMDDHHLVVESLHLASPLLTLQGRWEGSITPPSFEDSSGELSFSLKEFKKLLGLDLTGTVSGTFSCKKGESFSVSFQGDGLQSPLIFIQKVKGAFTFPWSEKKSSEASIQCDHVHVAQALSLDQLSFKAHGHLYDKLHPLMFSVKGLQNNKNQVVLDGSLVTDSHNWEVQFQNLLFNFTHLHLSQEGTASVSVSPENFYMKDLVLQAGKGSLNFSVQYTPQKLLGHLLVKDFPLDEITWFIPTIPTLPIGVSGTADLAGNPAHPLLTYHFDLKTLVKAWSSFSPKNTIVATASGRYNGQELLASLDAHVAQAPSEFLSLEGRLPLQYAAPFSFSTPPQMPLQATLEASGSLESFCPFFLPSSVTLEGAFKSHLSLGGVLKKPSLSGQVSIQNGALSSYDTGTVLKNLSLFLRAEGDYFHIDTFKATDGKEGCLEGRGTLSQFFSHLKNPSYTFSMIFKNFLSVSLDMVTATVSGELKCHPSADTDSPLISGQLTLHPLKVHIPKKLPDSLTTLPVTYLSAPPASSAGDKETLFFKKLKEESRHLYEVIEIVPPPTSPSSETSSLLDHVNLSITATIPPGFSIDGWGLQSFWEGSVLIGGQLSDPTLKGSISLVKGTFTLLSRTLTLDRGLLKFLGKKGFDPDLNVRASLSTSDILAHIIMKGTLLDPQFDLTSEPSLSESEIMSRILFGKSVGSLSPFQSLQIVSALSELAGTSSPMSVVHQLKDALGLGALNFTTGQDCATGPGGPGLSLGKEFSDEISVEIEQGLTPESTKASAQLKLFPQVTLQSDIDATSAIGVGVNWRWDY